MPVPIDEIEERIKKIYEVICNIELIHPLIEGHIWLSYKFDKLSELLNEKAPSLSTGYLNPIKGLLQILCIKKASITLKLYNSLYDTLLNFFSDTNCIIMEEEIDDTLDLLGHIGIYVNVPEIYE